MTERIDGALLARPRWWQRLSLAIAARSVGKAPDPWRVMAHVPRVFLATILFESVYLKSRACPPRLKILAAQRVSTLVGCPW